MLLQMVQSDWLRNLRNLFLKKMLIPRFPKLFTRNNKHKFVFTNKTIRLLALNFYEAIVNSRFALVNYHLVEISSS